MQLGAYQTEAKLGAGGMSQVWLARGPAGLVVLKRQLNPADDDRLREEASVGLRLRHPGVVQTLDIFEHEGRPILVLEYVAGASLVALRNQGALAPAAVCSLGADVAEALAALHGARGPDGQPMRVLHRDVSPANVIASPDGRARLIDLGIARAPEVAERTQTGDLRGTVRYLAPELFDGKPHSAQTDLWALGVCLFEAALGRAAVTGPEAVILASVVRGSLLDLRPGESLAPPLHAAIQALCAPVEQRAESAAAAARLLRATALSLGDGPKAAAGAVRALVEGDLHDDKTGSTTGPAALTDEDAFMRYAATTYCGTSDDVLVLTEALDELAALDGAPTALAIPPRLATPVRTAVTPSLSGAARVPGVTSGPGAYPFAPAPVTAISGPHPASPSSLAPAPTVPVSPVASSQSTEPMFPARQPTPAPVVLQAPPVAPWPSQAPAADEESRPFARSPRSSPGALESHEGSWDIPRPSTNPGDTTPQRPAFASEPLLSETAPSRPAPDDSLAPTSTEPDDLAELRGGTVPGWAIAAAVAAVAVLVFALLTIGR